MIDIKSRNSQKRIVYLLGAGATQAEVSLKDETIRMLMRDIKDGILSKIVKEDIKALSSVKNELVSEDTDVEHLITLYESTGISKHDIIAKKLKELFWSEIQERIGKLGGTYQPKLLSSLVDMHEIPDLGETIKGIITLNYEDLVEKATQSVKGGIDYSLEIKNDHSYLKLMNQVPPILKLHGSFNWKNAIPITLIDEVRIKKSADVLWIPPGVEKRRERYPFSILWGRAREILDCDVLRVIGCSLSRNDWQLVSLLYTTQKLQTERKEYTIELIDYYNVGDIIRRNYSYLNFRLIADIKEVRDFLFKSYFKRLRSVESLSKALEGYLSSNNSKLNIFDTWLRAKGEDLRNRSVDISTPSKVFATYMDEV